MSNYSKHKNTLTKAIEMKKKRGFWSPYPEMPSERVYGENGKELASKEFESFLNNTFEIEGIEDKQYVSEETSPFGFNLGITYPSLEKSNIIKRSKTAMKEWAKVTLDDKAGICLEILDRLNKNSFLIANTVMHTTGQPYIMAFQAGAPHAQDRGLEAIAYAYDMLSAIPTSAIFEKPQGKNPPIVVDKKYKIVPKGVSLVITCSTFPTWNSYSAVFASLMCGNSVVYKPHEKAILPIALSTKIIREVLQENNINPDLCLMALMEEKKDTQDLATHKDIQIIDFTGSTQFGDWLEQNATQASVYTEKAGVNSIVISDFNDTKGMCRNISFALSLYSSQMCTAPQNIFIPKEGILVDGEQISFDAIASMITSSIEKLLGDEQRAVEILGAIQSEDTLGRVADATKIGEVLLESKSITHPSFKNARVKTPLVLKLNSKDESLYMREYFGPIVLLIECESKEDSLACFEKTLATQGAITAGVYAKDSSFIEEIEDIACRCRVNLSENLTGAILMNHSAAFSDFHASGANKAANCSLANEDFISKRYTVVTIKKDA